MASAIRVPIGVDPVFGFCEIMSHEILAEHTATGMYLTNSQQRSLPHQRELGQGALVRRAFGYQWGQAQTSYGFLVPASFK